MNDCLFCKIVKGEIPSFKIYEDDFVFAFLDIDPKSEGHTLIIPKKHTLDLQSIEKDSLLAILEAAKKVMNLLSQKLPVDGFTIMQNNGAAQEVKHFHLHVIPYYTNAKEKRTPKEIHALITK